MPAPGGGPTGDPADLADKGGMPAAQDLAQGRPDGARGGMDLADPCAALPPLPAGGLKSVMVKTPDGLTRVAQVHLPPGYDHRGQPRPLVLNLHGLFSNPSQEVLFSGMDQYTDPQNVIVVYPQGSGMGLDPLSWNGPVCCPPAATRNIDDVGFIRQLIGELTGQLCVDQRRIYAAGMSNGGFMSHRLGCELSDKIAAIGPVAGQLTTMGCAATRPVPVMHFHGTKDPLVPYDGGKPQPIEKWPTDLVFPSVAETIGRWVEHNGCAATSHVTLTLPDAYCEQHDGCQDGADVVLCTVVGGGHTWPGGWGGADVLLGMTSKDLIASDLMLKFFLAHPMP